MSNEVSSESPVISIKLSLSPNIFHFSDPTPPTLRLHLTSNANKPITIQVGFGSPLDPKSAMGLGGFPITDLTTSPPTLLKIQDLTGRVNRAPSPNKRYLTIHPGSEFEAVSVAFTRGGSYELTFRPQPWEIVRRGKVLDEQGNERNIRRSAVVCGCDGLEAGKKYKVTVAVSKLIGRSWWWGTEAEVKDGSASVPTIEEGGEELWLPLAYEVQHGGVEFKVEE